MKNPNTSRRWDSYESPVSLELKLKVNNAFLQTSSPGTASLPEVVEYDLDW